MATDILLIRNKAQLWNDIVVEGLDRGMNEEALHERLCDEFRRELFEQMIFRLRVEDLAKAEPTKKNVGLVKSILEQTAKKWVTLIRRWQKYEETKNLISTKDLDRIINDILGNLKGGNDHDDGNEHPSSESTTGDRETKEETKNDVAQQAYANEEKDIPFAEPPVEV